MNLLWISYLNLFLLFDTEKVLMAYHAKFSELAIEIQIFWFIYVTWIFSISKYIRRDKNPIHKFIRKSKIWRKKVKNTSENNFLGKTLLKFLEKWYNIKLPLCGTWVFEDTNYLLPVNLNSNKNYKNKIVSNFKNLSYFFGKFCVGVIKF